MHDESELRILNTEGNETFSMRLGVRNTIVMLVEDDRPGFPASNWNEFVEESTVQCSRGEVPSYGFVILNKVRHIRALWRDQESFKSLEMCIVGDRPQAGLPIENL